MKQEQQVITEWMRWVMYRRHWSAAQWGKEAGISGSTITRAMQESYHGVTSLPVLDQLARAAGVPSPLDVLRPDIAESFPFRSDT